MPVGAFRSSKNSAIVVEDVPLTKSKWDLDLKGDDIDTTNFECGGVDQGIVAIVGIDWNFGGLWDASLDSLADPPGLFPRDDLGTVLFYTNTFDDIFWNLPTNRVLSSKNGAEVRQAVTFDTQGKLNGSPFDLPGNVLWEDGNDV